jgi:hypothetical protein
MKRSVFIILVLQYIIIQWFPLKAQKYFPNSAITGVCYAGNKTSNISIPPPKIFFEKRGSKGIASVTIIPSGFSETAVKALDYAASILETILPPDTKLTVKANWERLSTNSILGQSSAAGYAAGSYINALNPFAFYPVALAEKIAGKSFNDDEEGDITLTINSSIVWHFGTDAKPPAQRYDLVTVVLHEICHGLGFFDSMYSEGGVGGYGADSIPIIYDTFIENFSGKKLTDASVFQNPSSTLLAEYTGGQIYFNGPLVKKFTSGSRVRLYAPQTFDPGSSISHLEEDKDITLPENSLMTPFIDRGEAIHNPGKLTMSILGDLGWVNTRIVREELKDTEEHLTELKISVTIVSDTTYNRDKVGLVYSFNNFISSNTIYLNSLTHDDNYSTTISIPSYETELKYYFFAEDNFLRFYKSPSLAEKDPYRIYIGIDTSKPEISHTPVNYYLEKVDSIHFDALVTDNIGIDTVYIEYKVNDRNPEYIGLTSGKPDLFTAVFSAKNLGLNGGDLIHYRIIAVDKSSRHNTSILPKTGYYSIKVEEIGTTVDNYSTDFSNAANDFFNFGFEIKKPPSFSSYGLHSKHPYKSPEDNDSSYNFTAMLRHPVRFDESGMMISFNELVLVEPGEDGSLFGSDGFFDYVITEASKNFGKTWFKLIDGYDSRYVPDWENAYNETINSEGNSLFIGVESMMRKRTILKLKSDTLKHGDTLLIRFRLFSDPFANGWGWVIEDLKINQMVNDVKEINTNKVKVFPNPGNGLISITTGEISGNRPIRFSIFNSSGICVLSDFLSEPAESNIDISNLSSGLYIIQLYLSDGIRTIKYSLIR